jgi:hypothetical protein
MEETMRKAVAGAATALFVVVVAFLSVGKPAAQTTPADPFSVTAADREAIIKAYPGARGSIVRSIDTGKAVVCIWLDQMKKGPAPGEGMIHTEATEMYLIVEGAATEIEGGTLISPRTGDVGGSPTLFGKLEGGTEHRYTTGDIIVHPPGTPHYWKSVESPTLVYLNMWTDPGKKLKAGQVSPALKK